MTQDDFVIIVGVFGLKLTKLQLTEAVLVSCRNTTDYTKFRMDKFA